jgi:cyclophilin family peptidyl-prolyl cis-trans isomerase
VSKRPLSHLNCIATIESRRPARPAVERLEGRTLLNNPFVTGVSADNRGEVFIQFDPGSANLSPSTFNKNSVQMYEAGPDGRLATADDVRVSASIRYTTINERLLVRAPIPAGNGYRVKIVSSRIDVPGDFALDGEFNGTFPSGDGVAGGNFEFQAKNIKTSTPTVRMYTDAGQIILKLRGDLVGNTVNNFLRYANAIRYDNTFFHRDGRTEPDPIDIIQGGGYDNLTTGHHIDTFAPMPLQAGAILNTRGTISMARTDDPNSATSEFFFNIQDNSFLDPSVGNPGYAAFGSISSGQAAADAIFNGPTAVRGPFNNAPQLNSADVSVRRVSVVSKVAPL